MRILYLDCGMGAAGDMLTAALYELLDDKDEFIEQMNSLGIPNVSVIPEKMTKCGIAGTHMKVMIGSVEEDTIPHTYDHDQHHGHDYHEQDQHYEHDHHEHDHEKHQEHDHHEQEHDHDHYHDHDLEHHHHSSMDEIEHLITSLALSEKVKRNTISVYKLIAEAESHAHDVPVTEIHFHEVGTMDAIADITAVCLLIDQLNIDKVIVSPVHVGSGHVRCVHGILPVPAPATAYILRGVPIYGGGVKGELCTPTGAALLKHFANGYGEMPVMMVEKIGYGMGKKDFEAANCVRAMLGETADGSDKICELSCNLDDMTPERIGFASERLFEAGALDVYTVPIGMKKSRPGVLFCVMCKENDRETMISLIFTHTATIGIRENISRRYTLNRTISTISTSFGLVRMKRSEGYGITRDKYEFDDLARIANEKGLGIADVVRLIEEDE